jgi:F-type H+-transporting ATPase subunit epsilon
MVEMDKALKCIVVTPEKAVLDETVDFVALPMLDGELGVLANRSPLIGRLGFGELRTRRGDQVKRFYVDGGFAQVRSNVVTVLTPQAIKAEEIKVEAAEQALKDALAPSPKAEEQEGKRKAQARARAQIHIAGRIESATHQ